MRKYQILCIDDDEHYLNSLAKSLPEKVSALCPDFECSFEFVTTRQELDDVISQSGDGFRLAMLISDQILTGMTGLELLEKVKAGHPDIRSILLTGPIWLDSVISAVNRGQLDQYITKPIEDIHIFAALVANLLKRYHNDLAEQSLMDQLAGSVIQLRSANDKVGEMLTLMEQISELAGDIRNPDIDAVIRMTEQHVGKIMQADCAYVCERSQCSADLPRDKSEAAAKTAPCGDASCSQTPPDQAATLCRKSGHTEPDVVIPVEFCGRDTGSDLCRQRGYLCLFNVSDELRNSDAFGHACRLIGDIVGISMTSACLYQQAKLDREIDFLTRTCSRRSFQERLDYEYDRAVRYQHPFCLIIVDVDHFKATNDSLGHPVGDKVLCELAGVLGREIRATDMLARYGGDEFVILMPETDIDSAFDAAERMRRQVEANLAIQGRTHTISCGVAQWSAGRDKDAAEVLNRADAAMYQAKQAGRNCVHAADKNFKPNVTACNDQ